MVGHKVTTCDGTVACKAALAAGHFDIVLADPKDAAVLKGASSAGIIPVTLKPSKDDMNKLKADYPAAFDASRDAVRLLPLLTKAAPKSSKH